MSKLLDMQGVFSGSFLNSYIKIYVSKQNKPKKRKTWDPRNRPAQKRGKGKYQDDSKRDSQNHSRAPD